MFTWVNYEDLVRKKVKKMIKCLYLSVNYEFQPPNLRERGDLFSCEAQLNKCTFLSVRLSVRRK